ncbi:4'-phosphopantetheinyl transferase family protein [Thalassotalea litorea]|uniref:4'-phosphopantetheinyl transferase family protein n=1 Tax=Thalassotalea litorea TaxID=2020715 RepID=UPI003735A479
MSISHSKSWLAIAVSENPVDIPLGIDIEVPKRGRNVLSIAKHSFADEEYQALQKESDPSKTFYLLWTLKEALCKATSLSLLKVLGLESQALLSSNQLQCIGIPSEDYAFSLVASATTKVSQIELTNVLSD